MTILEDRLSAALAARAGQVTEADLAPAVLPKVKRRPRALLVMAAAACTALVIGVPYAVMRLDGTGTPAPPASTPTPTPTEATGLGADWPIAGLSEADLDGDGADDAVRLRMEPVSEGLSPVAGQRARVEVTLPGGTVFAVLDRATSFRVHPAADVDRSDDDEVLVSAGTALTVLDLIGGELRELSAPVDPPLIRRTDSQGRSVTWAVDGSGLMSTRSVGPVPDDAELYPVQRWRWSISDGALVAGSPQGGCVEGALTGAVVACTPGVPDGFRVVPLTSADPGESVSLAFPVEGEPAMARLVFPADYAGDWIGDDTVTLEVVAGGRTWRAPVPGGPFPYLVSEPVTVSANGQLGVLVIQTAPGFDVWDVYTWVDGELVALEVPDAGSGTASLYVGAIFDADTGRSAGLRSWVQDGWIYTSRDVDGDDPEVYRWDRRGAGLEPTPLGRFCIEVQGLDTDC